MNKNIIGLIFLFFVSLNSFVNSREQDTIFYNEDWETVSRSKASYYRLVILKEAKYFVTDYFMNGKIQMTGSYSDKEMKIREGIFLYYSKKGNLTSKEEFKNNKYDGKSSWFYENGVTASNEFYVQDSLTNYRFYNSDGTVDSISPMEVEATFPGGNEALSQFIIHNVKYPEKAIRKNQQERVFVKFVVETNGKISNVQAEKCKYPLLGFEAERVIKLMPRWKCGKYHNVPCRTWMKMPINFTLEK